MGLDHVRLDTSSSPCPKVPCPRIVRDDRLSVEDPHQVPQEMAPDARQLTRRPSVDLSSALRYARRTLAVRRAPMAKRRGRPKRRTTPSNRAVQLPLGTTEVASNVLGALSRTAATTLSGVREVGLEIGSVAITAVRGSVRAAS